MTKEELIRECCRELQLDPDKNPQSCEQVSHYVNSAFYSEPVYERLPKVPRLLQLMAQYIDSQD